MCLINAFLLFTAQPFQFSRHGIFNAPRGKSTHSYNTTKKEANANINIKHQPNIVHMEFHTQIKNKYKILLQSFTSTCGLCESMGKLPFFAATALCFFALAAATMFPSFMFIFHSFFSSLFKYRNRSFGDAFYSFRINI